MCKSPATGHMTAISGAQVIDVNVTNKGTRAGGIQSFTAMVVVGNYNVRPSPCLGRLCWAKKV